MVELHKIHDYRNRNRACKVLFSIRRVLTPVSGHDRGSVIFLAQVTSKTKEFNNPPMILFPRDSIPAQSSAPNSRLPVHHHTPARLTALRTS